MSNAVAKTKGVEVSTEVVVDMFEDGADGAVFAADDLLIPRLQLAQKMSPELDENDAKYIDGIKAGNFLILCLEKSTLSLMSFHVIVEPHIQNGCQETKEAVL